MDNRIKRMTATAMIAVLAVLMAAFCRIPVVLFLKYEPKDVMIALGGFIWGPLASLTASLIASLIEMLTFSDTGIWGFVMNVISTCSFACTAAVIYKKKRTLSGAVAGLLTGLVVMVGAMVLWNYLITPIYMGYPREDVAKLLIPAFLPFNLIKGSLNAAFTFVLYKPLINALRKAGFVEAKGDEKNTGKMPIVLWGVAGVIIVVCAVLILSLNGIFSV